MGAMEERHNLAEELRAECERLRTENAVFEAYLQRVNPLTAAGGDDREDANSPSARKPGSKKGKPKPIPSTSVKLRDLTSEEKYDIVTSEMEVVAGGIEGVKVAGEKTLSELRALLEETDLRIAETKKDTYEFKRDIVVGAENFRTGKTAAEKMLRYLAWGRPAPYVGCTTPLSHLNQSIFNSCNYSQLTLSRRVPVTPCNHSNTELKRGGNWCKALLPGRVRGGQG